MFPTPHTQPVNIQLPVFLGISPSQPKNHDDHDDIVIIYDKASIVTQIPFTTKVCGGCQN
jgi:hypothetical protein